MSNLFAKLSSLKNDPKAGALSFSAHESAKSRLMARISVDAPVQKQAPSYVSWYLGSFISKPVTIGVSAIVLFSGSLSTVSAASNSLPGDTLYSVKRITEQAQLRLASLDRRAVLHTEFAERRLDEATQLRSTGEARLAYLELAKTAMQEYATELSQASADLKSLKGAVESGQALAVVTDVQNKLDAMKTVIDQNAAASEQPEAGQEALVAKQAAKDTQEAATTVAVDVHEASATARSDQELKEMFKKELGAIEARQTFDEHRIATISDTISGNVVFKGIGGVPTADDLRHMTLIIKQTRLQIPEAMNGFAAGGYRSAFDTLQGVDSELLALEGKLADIEFMITTTLDDVQAAKDAAAAAAKAKAEAEANKATETVPIAPPVDPS